MIKVRFIRVPYADPLPTLKKAYGRNVTVSDYQGYSIMELPIKSWSRKDKENMRQMQDFGLIGDWIANPTE